MFVLLLSNGASKNLPTAFLELINLQTISQGRDSLELQSSLSPLIASQVQLALFHLLNWCSLQLPIVDIPSIDYLALSIFF